MIYIYILIVNGRGITDPNIDAFDTPIAAPMKRTIQKNKNIYSI